MADAQETIESSPLSPRIAKQCQITVSDFARTFQGMPML